MLLTAYLCSCAYHLAQVVRRRLEVCTRCPSVGSNFALKLWNACFNKYIAICDITLDPSLMPFSISSFSVKFVCKSAGSRSAAAIVLYQNSVPRRWEFCVLWSQTVSMWTLFLTASEKLKASWQANIMLWRPAASTTRCVTTGTLVNKPGRISTALFSYLLDVICWHLCSWVYIQFVTFVLAGTWIPCLFGWH